MLDELVTKIISLTYNSTNTPVKKAVVVGVAGVIVYLIRKKLNTISSNKEEEQSFMKNKKVKGLVDLKFLKKLYKLLKIAIPKIFGREMLCISTSYILMILRTYLTIYISEVNGSIVKSIVKIDIGRFIINLTTLLLVSFPSAVVNSGIEYVNKMLSAFLRENLTKHLHKNYISKMCFYQITNLDNRISNPDQIFTADIDKWANSLSNLYSNFSKPVLDIILFSKKLSETLGYEGPTLMILWYLMSGVFMRFISPPFGKLTAIEQTLEGEFRACHSALISHSEEIAFYRGNDWEKRKVNQAFNELLSHIKSVLVKRLFMGVFDSMLVKYGAVMLGYSILALPVFGSQAQTYKQKASKDYVGTIAKDYIKNSGLLINLARAVGKMVVSYKDLQNLAGYTFLVNELDTVITEINEEKFVREKVNEELLKQYKGGQFLESDIIEFQDIPIITPNGDILIQKMNFEIKPGHHTFIKGPNGCGKSSLFRILGNLWPLKGGILAKPKPGDIFYIPQRPYLPYGTLRDQIIYPHTLQKFKNLGKSDEELIELLNLVEIDVVRTREQNGLNSEKDWKDVLSGGEKQAIAMARLFYHKPKFAILDECTSACSIEMEAKLYNHSKELGITLITVSHRESLWKYHDFLIKFTGTGEYSWDKMPAEMLIQK